MNEELQSANEELEISREELQSINEELQTVNGELTVRVDELSRANSDISNLLESTQIATVFLDTNMRVKSFTPAAKDVFRIVESDTGRPISHLLARIEVDSLQQDAELVLRTLRPVERQVAGTEDDNRYIMRTTPYRTTDNIISGIVITFTDITRISAAEARIGQLTRSLRDRVESLETLLDLVPVGIFIKEHVSEAVRINRCAAGLLGDALDTTDGRPRHISVRYRLLQHGHELDPNDHPLHRAARGGTAVPSFEARLEPADGRSIDVLISATPLFDEAGKPRGAICAMVDIPERSRNERHREMLLHELQHRVKNILATISGLATRMLSNHPEPAWFAKAFTDRLAAMGRAHILLSERNWEGAELRGLIEAALGPHMSIGQRLTLGGAAVTLRPGPAATLGLALHELATNAVKHGSLSEDLGTLAVSWTVAEAPDGIQLEIRWRERGGPPFEEPMSAGFGLDFVRKSVAYELGGTVDVSFEPTGVTCTLTIPLGAATPSPKPVIEATE